MLQPETRCAWRSQEPALAHPIWDTPPFSCVIKYGSTTGDGQDTATNKKPQLDHSIQTMCVDLINATRALSATCRFGNDYTYGYMTNTTSGPDRYPYAVALGDDYAFGSH